MRKKPQKDFNTGLLPDAIVRLGYEDGLKHLNKEKRMTAQAQIKKENTERKEAEASFDFFPGGEAMWWPFRSVSKALLQTQSNALAYLEANRRLIDEMRNILRKEQELVIELSETALKKPASSGAVTVPGNVNEMFGRAVMGIRELGEAWIDAQVRSLDTMRLIEDTRRPSAEDDARIEAEAA